MPPRARDREHKSPQKRFHYAYSLFSSSGFTQGAQDMAVAHQVSLIDLSGPEYQNLRDTISTVGDRLEIDADRGKLVYNLRHALRTEFATAPPNASRGEYGRPPYDEGLVHKISRTLRPFIRTVEEFGELFVGKAEGPFMLLLKAEDPNRFLQFARLHPRHRISINWSSEYQNARVWVVTPAEDSSGYRLEFRIPKVLDDWIFETSKDISRRALAAKQQYLSRITVYHSEREGDRLFTLEFDPEATRLGFVGRTQLPP